MKNTRKGDGKLKKKEKKKKKWKAWNEQHKKHTSKFELSGPRERCEASKTG